MIVVVIAGRPVGLGPDAENANAILMAYQGSTEAGQAVADVIFGKINPSGKLPISWPSDAAAPGGDFDGAAPSPLGDQPKFFDQLPGTGSGQGHAYNPLYPFGFGLSYTTFTTSDLSVTPNVSRHGTATATFTVTNTGSRSGTDIVPVYVAQPVSSVVVPPQRLVGFTRVTLDAGQSKTVHVSVPGLHAGRDAGRHQRVRTADRRARRLRRPVEQERHDAVRRRRVGTVHHPLIHEGDRRVDSGVAIPSDRGQLTGPHEKPARGNCGRTSVKPACRGRTPPGKGTRTRWRRRGRIRLRAAPRRCGLAVLRFVGYEPQAALVTGDEPHAALVTGDEPQAALRTGDEPQAASSCVFLPFMNCLPLSVDCDAVLTRPA